MSPPGLRCETIIMLEHRSAFAHSLRGSSFTFLNYIHKCFDLRSAVSWATPIAVTDPTIVFDSHPSCQSSSRTKAAKARLMTSCLGSAPYRRGLNTVQLAFCVWSHFSVPRIDMQYLLGFGMHAHTHPHTHTSPWSMGWSVEPGVSLKTRSDNRDSCKGWKPILFQSPLHPSPLPPTATTHTHTHRSTTTASSQPNKPLFLARACGISFVMKWIRTRDDHEVLSPKKKLLLLLLLLWLLSTDCKLTSSLTF